MQAIHTKFFGPTNSRPARIKATADAGSMTVSWDYARDVQTNHELAALALAKKLGWDEYDGRWVAGSLPGEGYAHVFCSTQEAMPRLVSDGK